MKKCNPSANQRLKNLGDKAGSNNLAKQSKERRTEIARKGGLAAKQARDIVSAIAAASASEAPDKIMEVIKKTYPNADEKMTNALALAFNLFWQATNGDTQAANVILKATLGNSFTVSGDGEPIKIKYEFIKPAIAGQV